MPKTKLKKIGWTVVCTKNYLKSWRKGQVLNSLYGTRAGAKGWIGGDSRHFKVVPVYAEVPND